MYGHGSTLAMHADRSLPAVTRMVNTCERNNVAFPVHLKDTYCP